MNRGLAVAAIHCLIVLSIAGKYAFDRQRLPRAWAKVEPIDPSLPLRGRYASLRVHVEGPGCVSDGRPPRARLSVAGGKLTARPAKDGLYLTRGRNGSCLLLEPLAYFIPEGIPDPSRGAGPGHAVWVEVSVPENGAPRPLRLQIR